MRIEKGDRFPDFPFETDRRKTSIHEVLKGKTIFYVMRYMGCTVCRRDIHELAMRYSEFQGKNAQLFVVMQSDLDHIRKDTAETPLPFEIVSDPQMKIYEALDIRPAANKLALAGNVFQMMGKLKEIKKSGYVHGDYEGNELQLPALFIMDENGMVLYAHYASSLTDMPDVGTILTLL